MPLNKPEDFIAGGSGVFAKAPVSRDVQGYVTMAGGKVADAGRKDNSASTRLNAAYDAVLNLSLAVLASRGWRCTSAHGHHAQALEAACAYAGLGQSVFDNMDAVREVRNGQYGGIPPGEGDVKMAVASMERICPALLALLADCLPKK